MKPSYEFKKFCLVVLMGMLIISLSGCGGGDSAGTQVVEWRISTDVQTTRERTVRPVPIPGAPEISIADVAQYDALGYSHWRFGDGVDYGPLLPNGSVVGTYKPVETLLTFFSITDIHIDDKESPAELVYPGTVSLFGETNTSGYSPVILSTTQVLDAAVQTINVLHTRTPFDFGISLGDDANSTQYNELRWFIDVMDGKRIHPSSGAHRGENSIDYQRPYQAAGLDRSIPWYATIGNHDQYWGGCRAFNDYVRKVLVGNTVLDIGLSDAPEFSPSLDSRGYYVGTIDGSTPYGTIIDGGATSTMAQPVVAPDPKRRSLTTDTSQTLNWMKEFFNTTSEPKGHGFTQANLDNDFACYTFEPKASVPLKVIVLDDVCKMNQMQGGGGCLDQTRYDWLVNELDQGQAEGKLMIIAAHIPVGPRLNVPDAPEGALPNTTVIPLFTSTCTDLPTPTPGFPCPEGVDISHNAPFPPYSVVTDSTLLQTLHNYPNLILWISGHRHINTVTPQPAPYGKGPEFGFWEVETSSLRDFPQQFRTFKIVRNDNNTVSIFITNVDPAVQGTGSPAAKSRGYAIGANRIATGTLYKGLTDATSHVYNAELVKQLSPAMQAVISNLGKPKK
jgi:3',5'-cyclic AMP phosphodiesterase CpdA